MNAPLIINPNSVKLLLWQNVYLNSKENEVSELSLTSGNASHFSKQNEVSAKQIYYTLQIGDQRFISSTRQDKKGATYWRFRDFKKLSKPTSQEAAPMEATTNPPTTNA